MEQQLSTTYSSRLLVDLELGGWGGGGGGKEMQLDNEKKKKINKKNVAGMCCLLFTYVLNDSNMQGTSMIHFRVSHYMADST